MEIKLSNKALKKINKEVSEFESQIDAQQNKIVELEKSIASKKEEISALEIVLADRTKINIEEFLSNKRKLDVLNTELSVDISLLTQAQNGLCEVEQELRDNIYKENRNAITEEWVSNRNKLQSAMFEKLMELVQISDQLEDASKEYYKIVEGIGSSKNYNNFDANNMQLWNRFIFNSFGVQYSQHTTSKLFDFEESYFKDKK